MLRGEDEYYQLQDNLLASISELESVDQYPMIEQMLVYGALRTGYTIVLCS